MLTGVPPFSADNPLAIAYKQVNEQPRAPIDLNKDIPVRLNMIVLKALKKDKEQRYKSASEMLADLDSVAADQKLSGIKVAAAVTARRPEDKRITDRRMGDRRKVERRGFRHNLFSPLGWVALALAACLAGVLAWIFIPGSAIEKPLKCTGLSATTTARPDKEWGLPHLTDRETGTAWAAADGLRNEKNYVLFTFRKPVTVTRMVLYSGLQAASSVDRRFNRPRTVEVGFADGTTHQWDLRDEIGAQCCVLPVKQTRLVRVTILDFYPGDERNITPISEIEIWGME